MVCFGFHLETFNILQEFEVGVRLYGAELIESERVFGTSAPLGFALVYLYILVVERLGSS